MSCRNEYPLKLVGLVDWNICQKTIAVINAVPDERAYQHGGCLEVQLTVNVSKLSYLVETFIYFIYLKSQHDMFYKYSRHVLPI